jgi:hypothetical protein
MKHWMVLLIGLVMLMTTAAFGQGMDTPAVMGSESSMTMNSGITGKVGTHNMYKVECLREGKVIWTEEFTNLVPTAGLNYLLTAGFKSAGSTTWYVALVGTTSTGFVAGDTASSHTGWTEITAYTLTTRPALTLGSASSGSIDNSASTAVFTMTATTTVYGAAIIDSSTKTTGNGTNGLYGEGAFSTSRSVVANDVLNVTITLTVTASDAMDILFEFIEHIAALPREWIEDFRQAA